MIFPLCCFLISIDDVAGAGDLNIQYREASVTQVSATGNFYFQILIYQHVYIARTTDYDLAFLGFQTESFVTA